MVNNEEFTKRINQVMEFYDLTAASFADKINVGRSSISHLLSGRNKPSLDFVMKIMQAFPEVELYWLLNGKGSFPKHSKTLTQQSANPEMSNKNKAAPPISETEIFSATSSTSKEIKRIVVLYTDGTFDAYGNGDT